MVGLLEILPAARPVEIPSATGNITVDVRGLSVVDIRDLILRFPDVLTMLGTSKLDAGQILGAGPQMVAAVIAAACGNSGNADAEKISGELGAGLQAEILQVTLELTMPRGPSPFVALLKAAGLDLEKVKAEKATPSAAVSPQPLLNSLSEAAPSTM